MILLEAVALKAISKSVLIHKWQRKKTPDTGIPKVLPRDSDG